MDRSSQITLIARTYAADSIGNYTATETETVRFCNVQSVSRSEFYDAGERGIRPEYKVTMFAPDYDGQEIASLNSVRYSIYRTFLRQDELIELYLERKNGI